MLCFFVDCPWFVLSLPWYSCYGVLRSPALVVKVSWFWVVTSGTFFHGFFGVLFWALWGFGPGGAGGCRVFGVWCLFTLLWPYRVALMVFCWVLGVGILVFWCLSLLVILAVWVSGR